MLKTKLPLYLALLLLTQCSKCKHDDPQPQPPTPLEQLPAETQTGERTFGCLINGQAMVALGLNTVGDWNCPQCITISGQAGLHGAGMSMLLLGTLEDGQIFNLKPFNQPIGVTNEFVANANGSVLSCYYDGHLIKKGQVQLLKFDPVRRIAAGRFSFTLPPAPGSGCDTLRVTDGRFDIKF
jgi:hypothetical protein